MTVFIAHSSDDDDLAFFVNSYLEEHGVKSFIDNIDAELGLLRGQASLTEYLVDRLKECTALIAIVTHHTKESWWVPFEIGTAREMKKFISSFTDLKESSLPEFLLEWPRLSEVSDLQKFVRKYKEIDIRKTGTPTFGMPRPSPGELRKMFEAELERQISESQDADHIRSLEIELLNELNQGVPYDVSNR